MKIDKKIQAVKLRKKGYSYSEIKKEIFISQSTLSNWLFDVVLTDEQKKRLIQKRIVSANKGGQIRKMDRLKKTQEIIKVAEDEIGTISKRDIFILGVSLYWAEGAKQKKHNVSQRVCFSNSDPRMVKIFLVWLGTICNVPLQKITFELSIHKTADTDLAVKYWQRELKLNKSNQINIRLKNYNFKTKRKNIDENYHGLIRLTVAKSTKLNRKIAGWISGIWQNGEWCNGNTSAFEAEDSRFEP